MYDKCYFCLDQLPKLKKESIASFFVNFGRSRGTKEPTYITVYVFQRATVPGEEKGLVPELSRRGRADVGHVHLHNDFSCTRPQVLELRFWVF